MPNNLAKTMIYLNHESRPNNGMLSHVPYGTNNVRRPGVIGTASAMGIGTPAVGTPIIGTPTMGTPAMGTPKAPLTPRTTVSPKTTITSNTSPFTPPYSMVLPQTMGFLSGTYPAASPFEPACMGTASFCRCAGSSPAYVTAPIVSERPSSLSLHDNRLSFILIAILLLVALDMIFIK